VITVLQSIPLHRLPICGKMNSNMTKVLAVSDQVVERIYSLSVGGHFHDVDLILGCGDLPYTYLEYLITILNVPLYYVPGNHDPQYSVRGSLSRAEGGVNLDLKSAYAKGLLLAGFGGSIRYRPDGVNQYTQDQAFFRAYRLLLDLLVNQVRYGCKLDILISHSPPFKIHDDDTHAHQGLKALNYLIRTMQPRYLFHGHTHFYRQNLEHCVTQIGRTTIMNIFPYKTIEVKDG
jgi:Icc-related predicted phosphoesterase